MKTKAVRLYGKKDLRIESFELPPLKDDEILAKIVSDSICMSSYKAALLGSDHKRVPNNVAENPIIIGHEFCGEIIEVGKKWQAKFKTGDRYVIQPALNYKGSLDAPGYSFSYIGGDATYIIIPGQVMEMDCLLPYKGDSFFYGSLAEPMSCIVGAMRASYHVPQGTYDHHMGIKEGGAMAILAGCGPMGLGFIDITLHWERKPSQLIVTDIDSDRLARAESLFPKSEARSQGIDLYYLNTKGEKDPVQAIKQVLNVQGFDDIFVMAPVASLVEQADKLLAKDGCMNFFAGPSDTEFSARVNFYNMHYAFHHIVGTSGGNTEDMRIAISLMEQGKVDPAMMVTHIGGLNAVIDTTLNLPQIPGGKKLIYTQIDLPLTALSDFRERGKEDPLFDQLATIIEENNNNWCKAAEDLLLENSRSI